MDGSFVSAAIVTYADGKKALRACGDLLNNTKGVDLKLYVFDNASKDDTVSIIEKVPDVILKTSDKNLGFGAAHNRILNEETGRYHFVVNPDISFSSDVISKMAEFMDNNPDIVMAMPQILNPDGSVQYLPKQVPTFKRLFLGRLLKNVRREFVWADKEITGVTDIDFCTGCFFCIRGDAFKKLGGFDTRYFMYLEDADLTLRAKKYGRVVINPEISVVHIWERTSSKSLKYLLIHTASAFKFLLRKRKLMQ